MSYELELNKTNRLKLARVFRNHKRVDSSIDCVIEGQMGKAFVNDITHPSAYRITVGPFWYFAGEAHSPGGYQMMKEFPRYNLLQGVRSNKQAKSQFRLPYPGSGSETSKTDMTAT